MRSPTTAAAAAGALEVLRARAARSARRRPRRCAGARPRARAGRCARARPRIPATSASTSSRSVADQREDRAVVIGVGVDVEQPRVRARAPSPIASIVARSRPSLKFGTDSSGSTRRTLGGREGVLRQARAGVRRLVPRHAASSPTATAPGWDAELAQLVGGGRRAPARPHARRRLRHRLPDAASARRRRRRSTRARACSTKRAAQAPSATFVQGDALALPFPDARFDRVFTGHFYGHLERTERERFLAEARRVATRARRRRRVARSTRDVDEDMSGARPQRRLALGGLQALVHGRGPRRRARRRRGAHRRPLVRRRPRADAARATLPLARVAEARPGASAGRASRRATRSSRCR